MVLDASAAVTLLVGDVLGERVAALLADAEIDAPHLIDFEIVNALRRLALGGRMHAARAAAALDDFADLEIRRYPAAPLVARIWALRHTHTPYDAAYIALAEALDEPLLTTDARLARSHGHHARTELVE